MRWVRDAICLLAVVVMGLAVYWYQHTDQGEKQRVADAESNLHRLQQEVKLRAAAKLCELNARGWPLTIDPAWFGKGAPRNTIVDQDRPWVEIALPEEAHLQHPPVRMTVDRRLAAYWYNPYQGVVRARVPVMLSDESATSLYNDVNGTVIPSIFYVEHVPTQDQDIRAAKRDVIQKAAAEAINAGNEFDPENVDPTQQAMPDVSLPR
jgi:hypothetical protein